MRSLEQYIALCDKVTIRVKDEDVVLIEKDEMISFVSEIYGQQFRNRSQATKLTKISYLLGMDTSAKVVKGIKKDMHTAILYLKPYKSLFGNVCANGENCYKPCLDTSGRVTMDLKEFKILRCRYFRTILFYVNRVYFNSWLDAEISAYSRLRGDSLVVRLNGTSDLHPMLFGSPQKAHPNVIFYDYTKLPKRLSERSDNYHLTFSFNGYNDHDCDQAIAQGVNVAIVVNGKRPKTFKGRDVFDMDIDDLRPFDEAKGSYGYLKLKETLNKEYDGSFIIDHTDNRLVY